MANRIVALIPARAGSKRVPGKNTRLLAGHPLLAYAIAAAWEADIFDSVLISTESSETIALAWDNVSGEQRSRTGWHNRPPQFARDDSPDIEWVADCMAGNQSAAFAIIRPTSPFRRGPWIRGAWERLRNDPHADSIRAVRDCREHPAKMWRQSGAVGAEFRSAPPKYMVPILQGIGYEAPWHSMPTQMLPKVYTQTAALEIAWTRVLPGSISGAMVHPYYTEADAPEAWDINTEEDWQRAEQMAAEHPEWLPPVRRM